MLPDETIILSDVQDSDAKVPIGIHRVGVENIPKIIKRKRAGKYNELTAYIDVYVDLESSKRGIHMSRNIEAINNVTADLINEVITDTEELCAKIAEKVLNDQPGATHAEVHLKADYEMETYSEAIHSKKISVHKLIAGACAKKTDKGIVTTKIIGAEVGGITVCPCSQELSKDYARVKLKKHGYSPEQIEEILELVPIAAHNQRSKAMLLFELPPEAPRVELEEIITALENSMSAPLHEVMKRKHEQAVVIYAHTRAAFVEDVVRYILQNVERNFPHLPDDTIIHVKQINYESIHQHNALAETRMTIGQIRKQLRPYKINNMKGD